jgi:hypothetical protein
MLKNKRTRLLAGATVLLAVAALFATTWQSAPILASPTPDLFSMIPQGAPTLVFIDLSALRQSPIYKNRTNRAPLTVPNGDYANFVQATGFDFEKDLDRVVVAYWPKQATGDPAKTYVIAEGRFDHSKIRNYAAQHGKINQQVNHEVFQFPSQSAVPAASPWNSLVFLDDTHLAIVDGTDVGPLLVAHGDPATDPIQERIARVQNSPAFLIVHVSAFPNPPDAKGTPAAQFAALARTVDWISLAFNPADTMLRVSLEGECKTPADASQLHSALEFGRQLGKVGLDDPNTRQKMDAPTLAALQTLLGNLEISEVNNRVRVLMEITPEMLNLMERQKAAQAGTTN